VDFVAGNSNKLQKLGLEGKNQLSPQCVHIAEVRKIKSVCSHLGQGHTGYTSLVEKKPEEIWVVVVVYIIICHDHIIQRRQETAKFSPNVHNNNNNNKRRLSLSLSLSLSN
jgi:aconitase A